MLKVRLIPGSAVICFEIVDDVLWQATVVRNHHLW